VSVATIYSHMPSTLRNLDLRGRVQLIAFRDGGLRRSARPLTDKTPRRAEARARRVVQRWGLGGYLVHLAALEIVSF
jgi:hypothetical protein